MCVCACPFTCFLKKSGWRSIKSLPKLGCVSHFWTHDGPLFTNALDAFERAAVKHELFVDVLGECGGVSASQLRAVVEQENEWEEGEAREWRGEEEEGGGRKRRREGGREGGRQHLCSSTRLKLGFF